MRPGAKFRLMYFTPYSAVVAHRHHQSAHHHRLFAQQNPSLTPVALACSRRTFEAAPGERSNSGLDAQRSHGHLEDLVTAEKSCQASKSW